RRTRGVDALRAGEELLGAARAPGAGERDGRQGLGPRDVDPAEERVRDERPGDARHGHDVRGSLPPEEPPLERAAGRLRPDLRRERVGREPQAAERLLADDADRRAVELDADRVAVGALVERGEAVRRREADAAVVL